MRLRSRDIGARQSKSHLKRSKRSSSTSSPIIDDLPDVLLVEILCRLGYNKYAFQCKCVSKRWLSLISDAGFVTRFLCLLQKPIISSSTLVILKESNDETPQVYTTSKHPGLETSDFSLSFLPCFEPYQLPVVLGTHNDLVLCCATQIDRRDYYICNPYTKHWVALPPTPVCNPFDRVFGGFICDGCSSSSCEDYRWKVVRMETGRPFASFHVEMFSSENTTRVLREFDLLFPRPLYPYSLLTGPGVAYNGMLYWVNDDGLTFEFDPLSPAKCRFIADPTNNGRQPWCVQWSKLGVCQGCLRKVTWQGPHDFLLSVWELKQDPTKLNKYWCLIVGRVSLEQMVFEYDNLIHRENLIRVLDFHPNNKDILYLHFSSQNVIVMCNLGARTLEIATTTVSRSLPVAYPFLLQSWPTPVHTINLKIDGSIN